MSATVLENQPLAINMAGYIAQFVATEMILQGVFDAAIGGDGTWADSILHHVQSISTRVDIIEDFLKNCRGDTPLSKAVLPLIPEIRRAISYRNKLSHGLFADANPGGYPVIIGNLFSRKKSFKQEKITSDGVLYEFYRLEQLHIDLLLALGLDPLHGVKVIPREYSPKPD